MTASVMALDQRGLLRSTSVFWMMAALVALSLPIHAAAQEDNTYTTTLGSGQKFRTTIERSKQGELDQDDMRQVTALSSRVLVHLNKAIELLADDQSAEAARQITHAQDVARIVRELLPVTTVKTVIQDSDGNTVYDYTDTVQDTQIPIYESTIMMQVVQPIIEAQKDEAALQGLTLRDADFIYTSALLDLGYVERKLRRAADLLDDKQQALRQLVLAQTEGLQLSINEEDSPLVEAQAALRLAERMVGENKTASAQVNLQLARVYLESYQSISGDPSSLEVQDLRDQIEDLSASLDTGGMETGKARVESRSLIDDLWETVTSWMYEEPGQAKTSEQTNAEEE